MISYLYTMSSDYPFLIFLPSLSAPPCHCQSFPRVMTWVLFCVLVYPGHMYICATDLELTIGTWWDHQWVHKWGGGARASFSWTCQQQIAQQCVSGLPDPSLCPRLTADPFSYRPSVGARASENHECNECLVQEMTFCSPLPIFWLWHSFHPFYVILEGMTWMCWLGLIISFNWYI